MKKFGFEIILKNYSSRFGEIDLIAKKSNYIYFVEVKLRASKSFHRPKEAVVLSKQNRIIKTAIVFLSRHKTSLQPKFAVVEVIKTTDGNFFVNFVDDAFGVFNELDLFKNF